MQPNTGSSGQRLCRCWYAVHFAELRDNNKGIPFTLAAAR
jgi:hypothetical protein